MPPPAAAAGAAAPPAGAAAAAGAAPAELPTLVIRSLTFSPSKALANRPETNLKTNHYSTETYTKFFFFFTINAVSVFYSILEDIQYYGTDKQHCFHLPLQGISFCFSETTSLMFFADITVKMLRHSIVLE